MHPKRRREFFAAHDLALTFDDVLIAPERSQIAPPKTQLHTRLTRGLKLNIPIVSAAMDTVTESKLAIRMAQSGGIGFIHKNLSIEDQALEVDRVKRSEAGMIIKPITMRPEQKIGEARAIMAQHDISGLPIIDTHGFLVGILTNRDLRFEGRSDDLISERMTKKLITAPEGTTLEAAKAILQEHRVEKLPVVDKAGRLLGLITVKDIEKVRRFPNACKDELGRLRCGAAVGVGPGTLDRVEALVGALADVIVVDTAHGHSEAVLDITEKIRNRFPEIQLISGNIATTEAARDLIERGVDAVKVGIGPGSICTTRIVSGVGVPQMSALALVAEQADLADIPFIADGGIKFSGDIVKALAAGASSVMIGSLLAGADEAPGETILYQGRTFKTYRGMGSIAAMKAGSKDRYLQDEFDDRKLVAEGIEGRVPYKGALSDLIEQLLGGVRVGLGYVGAHTIAELQSKARFMRISSASLKESHVHDVSITKEAPNYPGGGQ